MCGALVRYFGSVADEIELPARRELLASRALNGRSDRGASEKNRDEARVGKCKLVPDPERSAPDA